MNFFIRIVENIKRQNSTLTIDIIVSLCKNFATFGLEKCPVFYIYAHIYVKIVDIFI